MGNTNNVQRHADRAMQFAPFAALKGYYESIAFHFTIDSSGICSRSNVLSK